MKKVVFLYAVLLLFLAGSARLLLRDRAQSSIGKPLVSYCALKNKGKLPRLERRPTDWFYRQRIFPYDSLPIGKHREAIVEARELRAQLLRTTADEVTWHAAGPTNIPGRVCDLAVDPFDPATIYVASASGGVFKTTNSGQDWAAVLDSEGAYPTGAVAVHPTNPNIVYVGTGEGNPACGPHEGCGVFKSVDAGATWDHVGLPNSLRIPRIIVDPDYPETVYVAVYGGYFENAGDERGVYRSVDGGATWDQILYPIPGMGCIDLVLHPSSNTMLAAFFELQGDFGPNVWRSTDRGDTWTNISDAGVGLPPTSMDFGRIGLTIDPVTGTAYAQYSENFRIFYGTFKSIDTGATWSQVSGVGLSGLYDGWLGFYFGNVRVAPGAPDIVYALGLLTRRSLDGGDTWAILHDGIDVHVDQHAMYIYPDNIDEVLLGNDGGVYRSHDGGDSWDTLVSMPNDQFYAITIDYQNPERLYGGTQDNGTLRTLTGGGDDWDQILGGDGMHCIVDYTNPDIIYASAQLGYLVKFVDGGTNYRGAIDGINFSEPRNWNTPVVMDHNDPLVLYYGTSHLYRSTDGAESWSSVSDDLAYGGTLSTIAVSRTDPDVVYVGADNGLVWCTTDGCETWSIIVSGLPIRYVTRVVVDPFDPAVVYVTLSGYANEGSWSPHIHRSTDYGQTWISIEGNLPDAPVNDVVVDYYNDSTLYVGNDVGVYVTKNLGSTWEPFGTGLPIVTVQDLAYHIPTRKLVAGTYGRSMYVTTTPCDDETDSDSDGNGDDCDNCPLAHNPLQEDVDFDLIGDACDECSDTDGDGAGDPGYAANTCPEDNCPTISNVDQSDVDFDGIGDICDVRPTEWDTVTTECLKLAVGNNGNFGHQEDSVSMDYAADGDCDPEAVKYIFDGTTVITYINDGDTIAGHSLYNNQKLTLVDDVNETVPTVTTVDYDIYETGTMVTEDSAVALEVTWWAPKQAENCPFIIKRTKAFPYDGEAHSGLYVGDLVDWDIPSDMTGENSADYYEADNLIYQQGYEQGGGCQSNNARFGGLALLGWHLDDDPRAIDTSSAYSAYAERSAAFLLPGGGPLASQLHNHMSTPGFSVYSDTIDLYSVMTYVGDLTLQPDDTLYVYSVLSTVHNGTVGDLRANTASAKLWLYQHVDIGSGCCGQYTDGITGNTNCSSDGKLTLSDITRLIDRVYVSNEVLCCEATGNTNGSVDCKITLSDITVLIDAVYISKIPPSECMQDCEI